MKSYSITLKDNTGRACELFINGDSIQELIDAGYSQSEAVEMVESNTFEVAVRMGEIGSDAWLI